MKNGLKVLRAQRDWSQAELAERLGVSRQTVNAVETGKYDPSLPLAFRIAAVFEGRIEDIFDPSEAQPADQRQAGAAAVTTLGMNADSRARATSSGPGAETV